LLASKFLGRTQPLEPRNTYGQEQKHWWWPKWRGGREEPW
jgi:hypothetical protein